MHVESNCLGTIFATIVLHGYFPLLEILILVPGKVRSPPTPRLETPSPVCDGCMWLPFGARYRDFYLWHLTHGSEFGI